MFKFTVDDNLTARFYDWHEGLRWACDKSADGLCIAKDQNRNVVYHLDFNSEEAKTYGWMYV